MAGREDAEAPRRYQAPYGSHRPIPTISKYRETKAARQQEALRSSTNIHTTDASPDDAEESDQDTGQNEDGIMSGGGGAGSSQEDGQDSLQDTSQVDSSTTDPKQRRKQMKGKKEERAERQVTDPVTHLPVTIHDFTDQALKDIEENDRPFGSTKRTATGLNAKQKPDEQLQEEQQQMNQGHRELVNRFPLPDFDALRQATARISQRAVTMGLSGIAVIALVAATLERWLRRQDSQNDGNSTFLTVSVLWLALGVTSVGAIGALIYGLRDWSGRKINNIFEDELWDAQRQQIKAHAHKHEKETTAWLNSLLGSIWPLINPDLFASLSDTLEDVMQASLPKLVRMVSVEDIGQGSESLRILGIRWLPTGAAAKTVNADGSLSTEERADNNVNGDDADKGSGKDKDGQVVAQGMEAEEGDFVSLEVAFAYRTRSSSKSLKERTKNMHLYLAFYLPGNVKFPVWVDLEGVVGIMRIRLQLTPDPPFFALCTMTFLGQPKVSLSCTPLSKHGLNIMDVPLISNFVQSAVDAAMAEYVAPKSLTLDLKDMLAGDDFKKDTNATGVIMINIKRGYDFKVADTGIPLVKDGSSDPYVSVGWAKFGKVLWSTRVLESEMEPYWDETCFVLVTPEELNIDERLRVQLWDSDRFTADDDLGRIEVNLKDLMKNDESSGKMCDRSDGFRALKSGDNMPGKLEWSIGYFSKSRIQKSQFDQQTYDPKVRSMDQLKQKVNDSCERKLREAMFKDGQNDRDESELEQQKTQELKTEKDAIICSAPPPPDFPSGLFSLQIHNITGLEIDKLSKTNDKDAEASDEEESGDGHPSSYCTVIVNHRKTFKTRTKPQNARPFFNAGCERFIRDWRDCEVYVSVRDARVHEDDPLLGIVHLPLHEIFKERSQVMGYWPLSGGIGHGRIRLSMVWRSVHLHAPPNLLGWQYGTVEIQPIATSLDCPEDLQNAKLKLKTDISSGKLYSQPSEEAQWKTRKQRNLKLAVQKRYASCLSISFKEKKLFGDGVVAFCVLWLKDIPDEEEQHLELPIWKGDFNRATSNCLDECGERVGTLKLKLTFWAGMGSAHSRWASGNQNLRDVVEVIDTARDNLDADSMEKHAGIVDESGTSDSDSDSDSSDSDDDGKDTDSSGSKKEEKVPDGAANDKQGPIDQVRDYRKREKTLHRQHRDLMQWKIPRTAKWVKHKWDKVEDTVLGKLEHQGKESGIETEV